MNYSIDTTNNQEVPKGYKQTKVGIIPEDWEVVKIGDVFDFIKTYSNPRNDLSNIGDIEYLHYGDIHTKYKYHLDFDKNILPKILFEKFKAEIQYVKNGDLFIADASEDYADIGKSVEVVNLDNKKVVSGLHTFLLRDKNSNFFNGYKGLMLYNQNVVKSIKKIATGTSVLGISKTNLGKLLVPLPPLKEQEKIANILTTWDDAISKQDELIKAKEELKKGLMQKLLSGEVRFDGFFGEWEEVRLGDIATLTSSKRVYLSEYTPSGIPFYRGKEISELKNNKLIKDLLYISEIKYLEIKNKYGVPKKDDILITAVGTLGNILRVQNNNRFYFKDGNLIWMKEIKSNSLFLEYLLEYDKNKILSSSIGSSQKALTIVALNKIKLKLPSIEEQQKIAEILSNADKEIDLLKNELQELKEQKKGLMQKLLTGEIRCR